MSTTNTNINTNIIIEEDINQYNEKMKIIYDILKFEELVQVANIELNKLNNKNVIK